jgi:hypothetical protein
MVNPTTIRSRPLRPLDKHQDDAPITTPNYTLMKNPLNKKKEIIRYNMDVNENTRLPVSNITLSHKLK